MERGLTRLLAAIALLSSCSVPASADPLPNETYVLSDVHSKRVVCLRMTAVITVKLTYIESSGNNATKTMLLTNNSQINLTSSFCNSSKPAASLYVIPRPGEDDDFDASPYYLLFNFTGSSAKEDQYWSWGNVTLGVDPRYLPDYTVTDSFLTFSTRPNLYDKVNKEIEFGRSYQCHYVQTVYFPVSKNVSGSISVSSLQVQLFKFKNATSGKFDSARKCLLVVSASKIVPIVVGCAIGALIFVVLLALIGVLSKSTVKKLWSDEKRHDEGYEGLPST